MTAQVVLKSEFATLIGVSRGRVSQLCHAGLPVRSDGRIEVEAATAWYRERIARPALKQEFRDSAKPAKPADPESFQEARRRREVVRARREELELQRLEGRLVDVRKVERAAFDFWRADRDHCLNWPARTSAEWAAELGIDPVVFHRSFEKRVRDFLTERADQPDLDLVKPQREAEK